MKFRELSPQFYRWVSDTRFTMVDQIEDADGVMFLCPVCLAANKMDPIGVHSIITWCPRVPQTTSPQPGRWEIHGTGYDDLSLVAGSSSVLLTDGCKAHFFIRNGEVIGA